MNPIIQGRELSCFYGIVLGLNNVSFAIGPGITGLVGPNGAGKSTLIKLLTGQIRPSSGTLEVFGAAPWSNPAVLSQIGYCPEHEHLHADVPPIPWLRSLGLLSGLSWSEAGRRASEALDAVALAPAHRRKRIGTYSKGMRQRVKLAQALLHRPRLVILDEPMNGLDPMGRHEIGDILRRLQRDGVHILISSHILDELQALCSHFLMINWGRVIASGTQTGIRSDLTQWSEEVVIRTSRPEAVAACLQAAGQLRGHLVEEDQVVLWLRTPEEFFARWPEMLVGCDADILEIRSRNASLANVFDQVTS